MKSICRAFIALAFGLLSSAAWASFQDIPKSVKAEALGGAFVALADDSSAGFINPAGLVNVHSLQGALMYGKPLYGVNDVDISEGYMSLGLPLGSRVSASLQGTLYKAVGLVSEYQFGGGLGVLAIPQLAVGGAVSYLHHSFDIGSDPAFSGQSAFASGTSKGAVGVNLGVLMFLTPKLQFGASAINLNKPDVGLIVPDIVPREIKFGALYRLPYAELLAEVEQRDDAASKTNNWKLGVEVPLPRVALRAGINDNALTVGFGLQLGSFGVDYAFHMLKTVATSNSGSQFLSVSYRMKSFSENQPDKLRKLRPGDSPIYIND